MQRTALRRAECTVQREAMTLAARAGDPEEQDDDEWFDSGPLSASEEDDQFMVVSSQGTAVLPWSPLA